MFGLAGCVPGGYTELPSPPSTPDGTPGSSGSSDEHDLGSSEPDTAGDSSETWRIKVINTTGDELWSFTESELNANPHGQAGAFAGVYSTINNWPTARFFAAEGYSIEGILLAAGVLDVARTITFRSEDGYEVKLTREQLLSPQYCFPEVGENDNGAIPVKPIIAYRWREGSSDLNEIRDDNPTLIIGQINPFQHTNPAFVIGVAEIVIDEAASETWPMASTFPLPGPIAIGETVNLQHPSYGLVKLHYTLDGSDPTPLSVMYNPSTYQLELNRPITITEPTTIKVLVTGFGKNDSEIAVFEFMPTT